MLDKCAPGWKQNLTDHQYQITWGVYFYPSFPKYDKIDVGHVRKMCRILHIVECAKKEIPQLR